MQNYGYLRGYLTLAKSSTGFAPDDVVKVEKLAQSVRLGHGATPNEWAEAADEQHKYLKKFGGRLPKGIRDEHETQLRTMSK